MGDQEKKKKIYSKQQNEIQMTQVMWIYLLKSESK